MNCWIRRSQPRFRFPIRLRENPAGSCGGRSQNVGGAFAGDRPRQHTVYNAPCEPVVVGDLKREVERSEFQNHSVRLGASRWWSEIHACWTRVASEREFGFEAVPIFDQLRLSQNSGGTTKWSRSALAVLRSGRRSADFCSGGAAFTSSCSRTQVAPCGTNTACKPAASAGLMSDFGLLPTIHVESCCS